MNGKTDITLRQHNSDLNLDLTRVIEKKIDVEAMLQEKRMVVDLLKTYAQQDVEIIQTLAQTDEKRFEMTTRYIDDRTQEYEIVLQPRRLFGFRRKADIGAEARQLAIRDGVELNQTLSITNNPMFQSIIAQRQVIKARLTQHFSNLLEQNNLHNNLDIDKIIKMIPH